MTTKIVIFTMLLLFTTSRGLKFEKKLFQNIEGDVKRYEDNIITRRNSIDISIYGAKKIVKPFRVNNHYNNNTADKSKVDKLSDIFKNSIQKLRQKNKRIDVVFLIDSSSSVGKQNFLSEIKFVKKMLGDFNVSFNHTRVAIVTFSSQGKIIRHIDHITTFKEDNDKCKLINYEIPRIKYVSGGTYTYGALKEAKDIFAKARKHSKKLICLITDGFSNGKNPVPIAQKLKSENITIVTFGIQSGNYAELYNISSSPGEEHSFLLDSFPQFESLARKALHSDYKTGNSVKLRDSSFCDILCEKPFIANSSNCCDPNAECTCGTTSGHYACMCNPGFYGSGLVDQCQLCPNGTYWNNWNLCKPCPDSNHVTMTMPALNVSYCECKSGFKSQEDNRCEVITCPQLEPPENGYFIKHPTGCGHVLNAACGARCKSGYQLVGSSIRLCQQNGTWSGSEAYCVLKTCPQLTIPYYGMVTCKNTDLNVFFDYTPRNETFMQSYHNDDLRITEPMPIDTDCNFKCGPGFYMVGSGMRNCLPLSKWDGLQTTCKQILCTPLPKVVFGEYDPIDCSEQKIEHGINCTIGCLPGFEIKGPITKSCGGKRNGVWSNKNKNPRCIDITPPTLICPQNFTVKLKHNDNYALVTDFPLPYVTDNSNLNTTYWIKPTATKDEGVKLTMGNHIFTYIAVDSFKNKAKCNFSITAIDVTPPVIDNCIDPPEILIPICDMTSENKTDCFIEWEDPIIYDNSNTELVVKQNINPGYLKVGMHRVRYDAIDNSGNRNECNMTIIVKQLACDVLSSPPNGQTLCAKNVTHTWCDVTCNIGYAIYDELEDSHLENFRLFCRNNNPKWKYEIIPDCTVMELPNSVEQILSFALDTEQSICDNSSTTTEIKNEILAQFRDDMCGGQKTCEILTDIPSCVDNVGSNVDNQHNDTTSIKNFYSIVKRDLDPQLKKDKPKQRTNLKIRMYIKISKKLGYWNRDETRLENIRKVKSELRNLNENVALRKKLDDLNINIKHLKLDELVNCRNGSVSKKHVCVQCPRGTFHNITGNICQYCPLNTYIHVPGQMKCINCPDYHSTRKIGSQSSTDCKQQCPPGSIARLKLPKRPRPNQKPQNSLMPFCRRCNPGEYQPLYNQIKCEKCPEKLFSNRGSTVITDCFPRTVQTCSAEPNVCGAHGVCIPEVKNPYLYTCTCEEGFLGAHCEHILDSCLSAPCQNGGLCERINNTAISCRCSKMFNGEFCENGVDQCTRDLCRNGATCIETEEKPVCECLQGYEGEFCEKQLDFCATSPCESGTCLNTAEGYYCKCPPGIIGRRCNLRPCDNLPCHKNAICIDLIVFPASRNSFVCRCPNGLKGFNCSQIESSCDRNPCRNNGRCIPLALRDPRNLYNPLIDERLYEQFRCECPPYFYGEICEILTTPDFVMDFVKSGVNDYVQLKGPTNPLREISLCSWIKTSDEFNYGTIISYATEESDNMFTLTDYNGFVLYINGSNIITDININDGMWHFICVAWSSDFGFYETYLDGELHQTGYNLSANSIITPNGLLILGQEQDSVGTSFSESESFVGQIAYLDIWNRFLDGQEVQEYYTSCEPYQGNLFAWTDFKNNIKGNVKINSSPFCKACPTELLILNGFVRILGNRAYYNCNEGYKIEGPIVRNCLRTSEWSLPTPYCRSIRCGFLPNLTNGLITMEKTVYGEEAVYRCHDGFKLVGLKRRLCMLNGIWSGQTPECISFIQCNRIVPPFNGRISYANERGLIKDDLDKYAMGTFAEIQCLNDTVIDGETFLSCLETAKWDYPLPTCVEKTIVISTTELIQTTTVDYNYSASSTVDTLVSEINPLIIESLSTEFIVSSEAIIEHTTSLESSQTEEISTEIPTSTVLLEDLTTDKNLPLATVSNESPELQYPDEAFWKNLKTFLYYGCENGKVSEFCLKATKKVSYSDLSYFEQPDSGEYQNMDTKLLSYLKNSFNLSTTYNYYRGWLSFENIFDFILYGNDTTEKLPPAIENSFRLVLCFYIDTILFDANYVPSYEDLNSSSITENIKCLLAKITLLTYTNYLKSVEKMEITPTLSTKSRKVQRSTPDDQTTYSTTSNIQETKECDLLLLPETPENSALVNATINEKLIALDVENVRQLSVTVPLNTKVMYECKRGFIMMDRNSSYTECIDIDKWSDINFHCKRNSCDKPPRPVNMEFAGEINLDGIYLFGSQLELNCKEGFTSYGNKIITCLPSGKWSKILSRCAKISCNKPKIPLDTEIISNKSYLYEDVLTVRCKTGQIEQIKCQSNGKWHPIEICL